MARRPRIDLDGVSLADVHNTLMPLVLFRRRTEDGLILQIPESADILVPWAHIEDAKIDLATGRLEVVFSDALVRSQNWLRGAKRVTGEWMDRFRMPPDLQGATRVAPPPA